MSFRQGIRWSFTAVLAAVYPGVAVAQLAPQSQEEFEHRFTGWTLQVDSPPPNDLFSNAQTISGPSGRVTGSNVGATDETGEPGSGSSSVWWQWRAPSSGTVTIDTNGSSFDTILGVYTGTRVDALTTLGEDDDGVEFGGASRVTLTVTAGTVYRLRVSGFGFGGGEGSIVLNWNPRHRTTCSRTRKRFPAHRGGRRAATSEPPLNPVNLDPGAVRCGGNGELPRAGG